MVKNTFKMPPRILTILVTLNWFLFSCGENTSSGGEDPQVTTKGSVEVTARLEEIPEGAIFKRDLYDYTAILKYQVLQVHRGEGVGETIFVGHYNPFKLRSEAADQRVEHIGGSLKRFRAGQLHRMALEAPIDDFFMGGIVNKYFGKTSGPIYFAVWTNLAEE
jgi:hypothetical protein